MRLSLRKNSPVSPASTPAAARNTARTSTRERGNIGEDAAARLIEASRYKIVARNWRPGNALRGEIDCIAWDEAARPRVLCFVEVKTRKNNAQGAPQEAVTPAKQRQISRLANAFVSIHNLPNVPCRFDVVEVWLDAGVEPNDNKAARCVLHRNAFDYCGDF
jgi:putative endonuclease